MTGTRPTEGDSGAGDTKTVLFVCAHGAGKSRMAAAYFAGAAPPGWAATTAGVHPGEAVSPNAVRLLEDSPEGALLDREAPRPVEAVAAPALIVSIDCDALEDGEAGARRRALAGTRQERWDLEVRTMDETMRDELRGRAVALADSLRMNGGEYGGGQDGVR
jgi:protein-tyrosine-phosphatase